MTTLKFRILSLLLIAYAGSITAQSTQDFFLDSWVPKQISAPAYTDVNLTSLVPTSTIRINFSDTVTKVSKFVFGNNANVYSGTMTNEPELMKNISNLSPNVIRWPGGNLSNVYFWDKAKGDRPANIPAAGIDPWYGKNNESWTMSVDTFYSLVKNTNSHGIICINYSYARYGTSSNPVSNAAHYAANWVRYDKGRTKFWELGNENFGSWQAGYKIDKSLNKDGQPEYISGDLYGQHCLVFIDSMKKAAQEIGSDIKIGVVAMESLVTYDNIQKNWNSGLFPRVANKADFYIVHSYYTPYNENSTVETILNSYSKTDEYDNYVTDELKKVGKTSAPVALTEWNIFAVGSKQSASYISGVHAGLVLGKIIQNKYGLACRWDFSNGWDNGNDHGLFSSGDVTGDPKRNPRPAFYYMYYFQKYFGDVMVKTTATGNSNIVAYGSRFSSGQAGIALINTSRTTQVANLILDNFGTGDRFYTYTLTGGTDNGDFSRKVYVNGETTTFDGGGPANYETIIAKSSVIGSEIKIELPKLAVVYVLIDNGSKIINSTASLSKDDILEIFPNPANEQITLKNLPEEIEHIKITDMQGKSILTMQVPKFQGQDFTFAPDLNPGYYLIQAFGKTKQHKTKLVIN